MQAVGVVVDMLALGRVVLDHAVIRPPEGVLDPAHFFPRRAALGILNGNADMLPAAAVACDYEEAHTAMLDDEVAVVAVGSR